MKNVIFIAPPAAGKGTVSEFLMKKYNYLHISTGELLRKIALEESELGREIKLLMREGKFINDNLIFRVLESALKKVEKKPFLLDGVPRNLNQAKYLTELFSKLNVNNYIVINLEINENTSVKRATGRRICQQCNTTYNIYFDEFKPVKENRCDKCENNLITRLDDTEETFKIRLETFKTETEPLINYYQELEVLKTIDANQSYEEIIKKVKEIIEVKND